MSRRAFSLSSSPARVIRVQGAGCRVQGAGFRVQGSGFRVQGAGCSVQRWLCRARSIGRTLTMSRRASCLSSSRARVRLHPHH